MKILWNSSTPLGHSGYGNIAKALIPRFKKAGHDISVATKHWYYGSHKWKDAEVFTGIYLEHLCDMVEREGFDYVISCWDIWKMHSKRHFPRNKWVGYIPIDTEWIALQYKEFLTGTDQPESERGPGRIIAMSKHGKREVESIGLEALYAPVGVDAKLFRPDSRAREKYRKAWGFTEDNFVIGSVGLNYGDDRKGFITLMLAFKEFIEDHPDARLYLHTHAPGKIDNTLNYARISDMLGLYDYMLFANQPNMDMGRITEKQLSITYNTFDVFCLPTKGEGFGMPIIEAAACGVPTIVTNTTTGPEFHAAKITPWLIDVDSLDDKKWMPTGTWRYEPRPSEILKCLDCAYNFWKYGNYSIIRDEVRRGAEAYDWDVAWKKYWMPILKLLEGELEKN